MNSHHPSKPRKRRHAKLFPGPGFREMSTLRARAHCGDKQNENRSVAKFINDRRNRGARRLAMNADLITAGVVFGERRKSSEGTG